MALYYDLKVFQDVYQLIMKIFEFTKDFPREYKYCGIRAAVFWYYSPAPADNSV